MDEYIDDLAKLIARLATELSETEPETELYEQRSEVLAEWLKIFDSYSNRVSDL